MSERILCVDDDANILDAYKRGLRRQFQIETVLGGEQALGMMDARNPYAVIVSDMRMPGMDGVQLLATVKQRAPESVRIMLTGNSDQQTAMEAVNEGNIFRFLTKPCPPDKLAKALTAGVEQYRLVTAEKVLLEKTLGGAIKVLTEVLSLTNPTAFGHASRVRRIVRKLCDKLKVDKPWQPEVAAMLSQIGCVTVPPETLEKAYHARKLTAEETQMLAAHPSIGHDLVTRIPRLEAVAKIIAYQQKRFDGAGPPSDSTKEEMIPLGARILKVALDYDTLKWGGLKDLDVLLELRQRSGWYDPDVLAAIETVSGLEASRETLEIKVRELTPRMILAEDVTTTDGALVVSRGQDVTSSLCQRLRNFSRKRQLAEPIRVLVRVDGGSWTKSGLAQL
ncbi:MAG: HD domain-containing phosphohydrolase [Planctomycetota bacterium]|jgi:response regulator RpfG family c-di-GMP phosphodiesterase